MKNKEIYIKNVDESAPIRYEISEVHVRNIRKLAKMFKMIYKESPSLFLTLKDLVAYSGGKPLSTARVSKVLSPFVSMVKWFSFLGIESEISQYLKQHGITITADIQLRPVEIDRKRFLLSKAALLFESVFGKAKAAPADTLELLNVLLEKASEIQKIIYEKSNDIRTTKAKIVEEECEIRKPHFLGAVNLKYKTIKKDSIDKDLAKKVKDIESEKDAISIF